MGGLAVIIAAVAGAGGGWAAGLLADRIGTAQYGEGTPGHDPDDQALAPLTAPTSSRQRLVLVAIGAASMVAFATQYRVGLVVAYFGVLLFAFVAAMVVDLQYLRLPNTFTYPAALVAVAGALGLSAKYDLPSGPGWVGALTYAGFLLLVRVAYQLVRGREGMGMGDIKLSLSLGASVGWLGGALAQPNADLLGSQPPSLAAVSLVIYAALLGNVLGAVGGGLALRRVDREFPFGPALVAGWVVVVVFADRVVG